MDPETGCREGIGGPALITARCVEEDVDGPLLDSMPENLEDMTKLDALSYTSPRELLAERLHMDQDLLDALHPGADFPAPERKSPSRG